MRLNPTAFMNGKKKKKNLQREQQKKKKKEKKMWVEDVEAELSVC